MTNHELFFAMDLSDEAQVDGLAAAVAARLLDQWGCPTDDATETLARIRTALTAEAVDAARPCHLEFHAAGGELRIRVVSAGGREWKTTVPLSAHEKSRYR